MRGLWGVGLAVLTGLAPRAALASVTGPAATASPPPVCLNDSLTAPAAPQVSTAAATLPLRFPTAAPARTAPAPVRTVVIDAGHGGRDHGCRGGHSREKEIALALALQLGERIAARHPGIEVVYTRTADRFVALGARAAIANAAGADLFISIHCNYMPDGARASGSETYVMGLHTADHNLAVAKRENAAVLLERAGGDAGDFDPESPAGHITLAMFQHAHLEQSLTAAEAIERNLAARRGRRSRGVRQAGFVVLKETAMPSVLVEVGYLSDAAEERYLASVAGQAHTAEALYGGFADYLAAAHRPLPAPPLAGAPPVREAGE